MQRCLNLIMFWLCLIEQFLEAKTLSTLSFKKFPLPQPFSKQAIITPSSYQKFLVYLEDTCQLLEQHNADIAMNHVDARYFKWEQHNFNKALLHHIFPETEHGDFSRDETRYLDQGFFAAELPSNCTSTDNDWTFTAKEADVFQDNLINWVFNTDRDNY